MRGCGPSEQPGPWCACPRRLLGVCCRCIERISATGWRCGSRRFLGGGLCYSRCVLGVGERSEMNRFVAVTISLMVMAIVIVPYVLRNPFAIVVVPLLVFLTSPVVLVPLILKPNPSMILGLGLGESVFFVLASLIPILNGKGGGGIYLASIPGAVIGGFVATRWLGRQQSFHPVLKSTVAASGVLVGGGALLLVLLLLLRLIF